MQQAEKARDLLGIRGAKDSLEQFLPAKRDDSGVVHLIDFVVGIAMLLIQLVSSCLKDPIENCTMFYLQPSSA